MTKKNLHNIQWFYGASRGKNHAVLFVDAVSRAHTLGHPKSVYGLPYKGRYYLQCNGARNIGVVDERAVSALLEKRMKAQPDFFYRYGTKMLALEKDIRAWTDRVKRTDWEMATNAHLSAVIREHCLYQSKLWSIPLAYAYYFYLNDRLVEPFVAGLRKRLGKELDALLPALLSPEKMSEISEEKRELLILARKAKGEGIEPSVVERHWKTYAYLNNYYYAGHGYSFKDMLERLEEEMRKESSAIDKEIEGLATSKVRVALFTPEEKIMIRSMRRMAHAFQYADETLAYCIHNIRGAYTETARRLDISYEELVSMKLEEIGKSLKKRKSIVPRAELAERYRDHVFVAAGSKTYVFIGKEKDALKQAFSKDKVQKVSKLTGSVAYKGGVVRGAVRVVSHADEIDSFHEGEILVTAMTNPSFVPAMRKAAAIVTNDGGLLCHAAIVSPELKKPCIIGTKIATKVLKDGDVVEVDAKEGVVRILGKT